MSSTRQTISPMGRANFKSFVLLILLLTCCQINASPTRGPQALYRLDHDGTAAVDRSPDDQSHKDIKYTSISRSNIRHLRRWALYRTATIIDDDPASNEDERKPRIRKDKAPSPGHESRAYTRLQEATIGPNRRLSLSQPKTIPPDPAAADSTNYEVVYRRAAAKQQAKNQKPAVQSKPQDGNKAVQQQPKGPTKAAENKNKADKKSADNAKKDVEKKAKEEKKLADNSRKDADKKAKEEKHAADKQRKQAGKDEKQKAKDQKQVTS